MAIPLGDVRFTDVQFDAEALGIALSTFVTAGSNRNAIAISDISVISRSDPPPQAYPDVAAAITGGTRLFDALAYFSIPAGQRPAVIYEELEADEEDPSIAEISRAVFYVYFWTFIRGVAPSIESDVDVGPVPNFLRSVMGYTDDPDDYAATVASFEIRRLNPSWIRHIRINNLSQETQNRLALGVAGYRVPAAIVYLPWHDRLDANILRAAQAVRRFVRRGMTWDCYSGTRSPAFLDAVKNFNKNVDNLLLDIVPAEYLAHAVTTKMLAVAPARRPQYMQYLSWNDQTFAAFTDFIFGENALPAGEEEQHHVMALPAAAGDEDGHETE